MLCSLLVPPCNLRFHPSASCFGGPFSRFLCGGCLCPSENGQGLASVASGCLLVLGICRKRSGSPFSFQPRTCLFGFVGIKLRACKGLLQALRQLPSWCWWSCVFSARALFLEASSVRVQFAQCDNASVSASVFKMLSMKNRCVSCFRRWVSGHAACVSTCRNSFASALSRGSIPVGFCDQNRLQVCVQDLLTEPWTVPSS